MTASLLLMHIKFQLVSSMFYDISLITKVNKFNLLVYNILKDITAKQIL